jgi:hypothetical protein
MVWKNRSMARNLFHHVAEVMLLSWHPSPALSAHRTGRQQRFCALENMHTRISQFPGMNPHPLTLLKLLFCPEMPAYPTDFAPISKT